MRKLNLNIMHVDGVSSEQQMRILKEVGWDGYFDGDLPDLDFAESARLAREIGLTRQSFHAPFDGAAVIWENGGKGDREVDRQIGYLRLCAEYGVPVMVMHAIIGMDIHSPTHLGTERFGKIFAEAERLGVTVALENTEGEEYLERLLTAYRGCRAVKFCIDTGHEMCYNDRRDLIGKYGDRLVCTHLNDNMGRTGDEITFLDDSHMMPFDGTADWQNIADRLNRAGYTGDLTFELTYESRPHRDTHRIYAGLDYRGFVTRLLEKARAFAAMLDGN